MEPSDGERGLKRPARPPTDLTPQQRPIDRAIHVATDRLTHAQEEFAEILTGGAALDQADTVVRRAEDLEILAEDGHQEAREKIPEDS